MRKFIKLSILIFLSIIITGISDSLAASTSHKIIFRRNAGNSMIDGELWAMNPDGSGQKRLISKFDGNGLAMSPDGKTLAFNSGRLNSWVDELFTMDMKNQAVRRVTDELHYVSQVTQQKYFCLTRSREAREGRVRLLKKRVKVLLFYIDGQDRQDKMSIQNLVHQCIVFTFAPFAASREIKMQLA